MAIIRRRTFLRLLLFVAFTVALRFFFLNASPSASVASYYASDPKEIRKQGVLDLVTRSEKHLDARKHKFLQARIGRDERPDLFSDIIQDGVNDYWNRFQKP